MSRESNLTRLWLKWVESELSRPWKSRIWVESQSNHTDRHLSQSWVNWIPTAWVIDESLIFLKRKREDVAFICRLTGKKKNNLQLNSTAPSPPPPGQQLLAKLGKIWWIVSQIWLNYDSNELSLSWVTRNCNMSQSRVNPKNLSRAQLCTKSHKRWCGKVQGLLGEPQSWWSSRPTNCIIGGGTGGALGHRAPDWMRDFNINPMGVAWKDWGQSRWCSRLAEPFRR